MNTSAKKLIVFMAEGMPANAIAALGHPQIKTPNLDRLAGQSAVFRNAYCTQPVCTAGRASLFTGRYPHETCPDNEHNLPAASRCLPELADFSDYRTAMIGKWDLGDEVFPQHGFETWRSIDESRTCHYSAGRDRSQGTHYAEFLGENGFVPDKPPLERGSNPLGWFNNPVDVPENLSPDAYAAREAGEFISRCGNDPFLMYIPFLRCKPGPFDAEDEIYRPEDVVLPESVEHDMVNDVTRHPKCRLIAFQKRDNTSSDWRRQTASYLAKITLIDRYVGEVLDELERQNKEDETIVVFTGDHGFMFGEHGMDGKTVMLEESVKVPMMIRVPGMTDGGRVIDTPFSHIDLVPTLLDLMGRKSSENLPGKSWRPVLYHPDEPFSPNDVIIEWNGASPKGIFNKLWPTITNKIGPYWKGPDMVELARIWTDPVRTIITPEGWKYNHSSLGYHELFNLNEDPNEFYNLAGNPDYGEILNDLRERLEKWRKTVKDDPRPGEGWFPEDGFIKEDVW